MAKQEHDREDLLRDATGYVRRIEFISPHEDEPIFCGFRECGAFSVYFGQDQVLQYNADNELRRGFWRERMLASYRRELHWLSRSEGRIRLARTPLTVSELDEFRVAASAWLDTLHSDLKSSSVKIQGRFPEQGNVQQEVMDWLSENKSPIQFAVHPGLARTKKKP